MPSAQTTSNKILRVFETLFHLLVSSMCQSRQCYVGIYEAVSHLWVCYASRREARMHEFQARSVLALDHVMIKSQVRLSFMPRFEVTFFWCNIVNYCKTRTHLHDINLHHITRWKSRQSAKCFKIQVTLQSCQAIGLAKVANNTR